MVKLMTLNLWGYEQWDTRKGAISSLISEQSPDIVALQEVQLDAAKSPISQAAYLAQAVDFQYVVYAPSLRTARHPRGKSLTQGYSHGLALLSKYPILSSESYLLSQGVDFQEPCSVLFATVEENGEKTEICNVHFGNTDNESSEHLKELLEICTARNSRPIILGDFNIFGLGSNGRDDLLDSYILSTNQLDYISIPKNNDTLDYIAVPEEYSFASVNCPDDRVSDHRAVIAEIKRA